VKVFRATGRVLSSSVNAAWTAFDIRDVFVLGGCGMLGYGLYLHWGQWLALTICGPLLMTIGYLMKDGK